MKQIKFYSIMLVFMGTFLACSPNYEEAYHEEVNQFKSDSLKIIQDKVGQIESIFTLFDSINQVAAPMTHKEYQLVLEPQAQYEINQMNTLFLNRNVFDNESAQKIFNENLDNINHFVNNESLSMESVGSFILALDYFKSFKNYCHAFVKSDYLFVQKIIKQTDPQLIGSEEYIMGEYTVLVALYDLKEQKMLDNFIYTAQNSPELEYLVGEENPESRLKTELFMDIRQTVSNEISVRYTASNAENVPLLESKN